MENTNHPISSKNEQNGKNSFFPILTKSEIQILIKLFKNDPSYLLKYIFQEIKNRESQIINNKSNAAYDETKNDEISNTQLVNYQFANSKGLNNLNCVSKINTYSSIILPNLREGNLPTYILILTPENDGEGIKWMTFNLYLYDNIWIKEGFIFSNFLKMK